MGTYIGTNGNDMIQTHHVSAGVNADPPGSMPSDEDDSVAGFGGNDWLDGGGGIDAISGDEGVDLISGGPDGDYLYGGPGNDSRQGGSPGDDAVFGMNPPFGGIEGGGGDDWLYGESGNDSLFGGNGDDYLDGGTGRDSLSGNAGADLFFFTSGDTASDTTNADVIRDFKPQQGDQIILTATNGTFNFSSLAQNHPEPGEVSYWSSGNDTIVSFNDGGVENIVLINTPGLTMIEDYFIF